MLKNIKAGFIINSLFLFNPDKVLRNMLIPLAEPAILRADKIKIRFYRQNIKL